MKKIIAILLIMSLFFTLFGCTTNNTPEATEQQLDEHTKAIVGVWKSTTFYMVTFNEDKTGTYLNNGINNDFTWSYDEGLSCYTVASPSFPTTLNFFLKSENGINYLECSEAKLYRDKDFGVIKDEYLDKRRAELAKEFNIDTISKIEFQKPYVAGDLSITFTELVIENNEMNLYIDVTNNGASHLETLPNNLLSVGFRYSSTFGFGIGCDFDFFFVGDCTAIAPGKTETLKARIDGDRVTDTLTVFETVIGYSTCTIGEKAYYIDLEEYTVK